MNFKSFPAAISYLYSMAWLFVPSAAILMGLAAILSTLLILGLILHVRDLFFKAVFHHDLSRTLQRHFWVLHVPLCT